MIPGEAGKVVMIPEDPVMLYSYINTMLRDRYPSLNEFCEASGVREDDIILKLRMAGFEYDEAINQFR